MLMATVLFSLCSCAHSASASPVPAGKAEKKQPLPPSFPPKTSPPGTDSESAANYQRALLLVQTMEMLRKNYVDSGKVSYEELFNNAMRGMISALDPYSDYEAPREHSRQQIRRSGALVGIGAAAVKPDGRPVTLIRILPGTPAAEAKLQPGDQILAIDGQEVRKLNLTRALSLLRGAPGTKVLLKIRRNRQEFSLTLQRREVKTPSVAPGSVRLLPGRIGYFKLTSFSRRSPQEVEEALRKLKKLGARALIMDLRYNPGGLVDAGVTLASMFLGPGKVVYRATARNKAHEQTVKSFKSSYCDTATPLLLLTNAFSASCSEILSGALQDHRRARLLGVRTFGKGTILRVVPSPGGGAIRYASSRYVTPGGRVIEKRGIIPDIEVRIPSAAVMRLSSQTLRYPGQLKPSYKGCIEDLQLRKAVELLQRELSQKTVSHP